MEPQQPESNLPPNAEMGIEISEAQPEQERFDVFRQALFTQTPHAIFTVLILLANLAVFGWMVQEGVSAWNPTPFDIIEWGANYGPRTLAGETWRLVTCMFLHIGLIHLGLNMLALWNIGRVVERVFGHVGYLLIYLLSGLAGSIASVLWNPVNPSAGASGAIFGIAGAFLGGAWALRRSLPRAFLATAWSLGINLVILFVVFTALNAAQPMIDNAAHFAGFLTGAICGVILAEPIPLAGHSRRIGRNLFVAVAGAAALFAAVDMLPKPPADIVKLEQQFFRVSKTVYDKLEQANGRREAGAMTAEEYAKYLETEVLPRWQELGTDFAETENVPEIHQPAVKVYSRVIELYESSLELKIEAIRENDPRKDRKSDLLFNEAMETLTQMQEETAATVNN